MSKAIHEVKYLDGLRGIAAFLVFIHHFGLAFYCAYYTWDVNASHLPCDLEVAYGRSVLSFLSNGNFCVMIFFVLSGYVLSRKYIRTNDLEIVISGLHRRFLRLYIPVACTLVISCIMIRAGLFYSEPVSKIAHSEWWFGDMFNIPDPVGKLIACLGYTTMFNGDNVLDTSLWTISVEFYGSLLVFAFLAFTHFTRYRLALLGCMMYYFFMMNFTHYMAFMLGISLCYTELWLNTRDKRYTWLWSLILLPAALILGSYPSDGAKVGNFFLGQGAFLAKQSGWYHTIGAYFIIIAFMLSSRLQRLLSRSMFRFLGYISFTFYLLHPLVMGSFSSWLFLRLHSGMGYNYAALMVFLCSTALLFVLSWLMARYVDQYGIRTAKRLYQYFRKPVVTME